MELADLVRELDAAFHVDRVTSDDWAPAFRNAFGEDTAWADALEPGFRGRWAGLAVRGGVVVEQAVTCVFPGDGLIAALPPRTLLFAQHPLDYSDRGGFEPVVFDRLRERGSSLYVAHVPLHQHAELAPSRLLAQGLGLHETQTFFPFDPGLPGGVAVIGASPLSVDGVVDRARVFLGPDIPVHVLTRTAPRAGNVAVVAGNGARADLLQAALDRGCETYVTGNAATNSDVARVRERVRAFRALADAQHVSLVDVTHYGSERPAQLAMLDWFRRRGLPARFAENGPR